MVFNAHEFYMIVIVTRGRTWNSSSFVSDDIAINNSVLPAISCQLYKDQRNQFVLGLVFYTIKFIHWFFGDGRYLRPGKKTSHVAHYFALHLDV